MSSEEPAFSGTGDYVSVWSLRRRLYVVKGTDGALGPRSIAWSPDDAEMATVGQFEGLSVVRVFRLGASRSFIAREFEAPGAVRVAWRDEKHLYVLASGPRFPNGALLTYSVDGKDESLLRPRDLGLEGFDASSLAVKPGAPGAVLLGASSSVDGPVCVHEVDVESRKARELRGSCGGRDAVYSPSGDSVAFEMAAPLPEHRVVVVPAHGQMRELVVRPWAGYALAWG
jgi:hypothetical protein